MIGRADRIEGLSLALREKSRHPRNLRWMVLVHVLLDQRVRAFPMEEVDCCEPLAEVVLGLLQGQT